MCHILYCSPYPLHINLPRPSSCSLFPDRSPLPCCDRIERERWRGGGPRLAIKQVSLVLPGDANKSRGRGVGRVLRDLCAARTKRTRAAAGRRAAMRNRTCLLCAARTMQTRTVAGGWATTRRTIERVTFAPPGQHKQDRRSNLSPLRRLDEANKNDGRGAGHYLTRNRASDLCAAWTTQTEAAAGGRAATRN